MGGFEPVWFVGNDPINEIDPFGLEKGAELLMWPYEQRLRRT